MIEIQLWPTGEFWLLKTDSQEMHSKYHVVPFHTKLNSSNIFYYGQVSNSSDLSALSVKIRLAFPNSNFSANFTYIITWIFNFTISSQKTTHVTLYQVALCMQDTSSFMIISYQLLGIQSDTPPVYCDSLNKSHSINASTSASNCNVPGQFIFQLNTLNGKNKI
jgi:hypothetical protein